MKNLKLYQIKRKRDANRIYVKLKIKQNEKSKKEKQEKKNGS